MRSGGCDDESEILVDVACGDSLRYFPTRLAKVRTMRFNDVTCCGKRAMLAYNEQGECIIRCTACGFAVEVVSRRDLLIDSLLQRLEVAANTPLPDVNRQANA